MVVPPERVSILQFRIETDYGIRTMLYLALNCDGSFIPSAKIAEGMGIPPKVLPRVLVRLSHSGLVRSKQGVSGGHQLNRPRDAITLLDIIQCMEDRLTLNRNRQIFSPSATTLLAKTDDCLFVLGDALKHSLALYTLQDLVNPAPISSSGTTNSHPN